MKMLTTALIEKLLKVRNLFNMWKARNLTIKGKITSLRSKVLHVLLYVATIAYVPDTIIKQIDDLFYILFGLQESIMLKRKFWYRK